MIQQLEINKIIIDEFIDAVKKVLNINAGEDIEDNVLFLGKTEDLPGEISATIDMTGDINGKAAISFTREYAKMITSKIIGCDCSELSDEDVQEGLGEILNQITGNVRTMLKSEGYTFEISTPHIMNTPICQIATNDINPVHNFIFKSKESLFSVQLNVQEKIN